MGKTMKFSIGLALTFFCSTFSYASVIDLEKEHDANYRKFFCNTEKITAVTDLPDHLIEACKKSGIDPQDIHVFEEDCDGSYCAYTIGSNIVLNKEFWQLDVDTQAWYFAHELSHFKHKDTERLWNYQGYLVDFQIASSATALIIALAQVAIKKWDSLPALAGTTAFWGLANIAALHLFYAYVQKFELRANDAAAHAVGTDAAIRFLKEVRWKRDYGENANVRQRLNIYKTWLGFCNHGSEELQLARMEAIAAEQKNKLL